MPSVVTSENNYIEQLNELLFASKMTVKIKLIK